jgi:hypothetical protein
VILRLFILYALCRIKNVVDVERTAKSQLTGLPLIYDLKNLALDNGGSRCAATVVEVPIVA